MKDLNEKGNAVKRIKVEKEYFSTRKDVASKTST